MLVTKKAPEFKTQAVMPDNTIQEVNLSDYKGKKVVLFFYPLDFTFVCPTELLDFDKFEIWSGFVSISENGFTIRHRLLKSGTIHATCDINTCAFSKVSRNGIRLSPEVLTTAEKYRIPGKVHRFLKS